MRRREPLVVFADDWGRHPSSCQRLVSRMLADRDVLWVNTIGTRRPSLSWSDLKRAAGKLRRRKPTSRSAKLHGPKVINPPMWPGFGSTASRGLNAWLLSRWVGRAIRRHLRTEPTVLTTLPITADLVGRLPARRWVYYCVDDFAAWPGLDGPTLASMEHDLLQRVDEVCAVSQALVTRAAASGHRPMLLTHGVDPVKWQSPAPLPSVPTALERLRELPRPRAVYWGLIDPRMDGRLLHELSQQWSGSIALVGPTQGDVSELAGVERVTLTGAVEPNVLPHVAAEADVLIMPYRDCEVTRAMQPLKLLEYLATEKPVVCADLPELRNWADGCDVVSRPVFAERVVKRAAGVPEAQLAGRRRRLIHETWDAKAAMLETMLEQPNLTMLEKASRSAA